LAASQEGLSSMSECDSVTRDKNGLEGMPVYTITSIFNVKKICN
jgi:hypothetical protein